MTLDDAIAEVDPRYPALRDNCLDTKAIEQKLKSRTSNSAQGLSRLERLAHDPELFRAALEEQDVEDFMARLNNSPQT